MTNEEPSPNGARHGVIPNSFVFRHSSFVLIDRHEAVRVNLPMQLRRLSIALAVLIMCAGFLPGQPHLGSGPGLKGVIRTNPIRPVPVRADPASPQLRTAVFVGEGKRAGP